MVFPEKNEGALFHLILSEYAYHALHSTKLHVIR